MTSATDHPAMARVLEQLNRRGQRQTWLARELGVSRQRIHAWRKRGIPAERIDDVSRLSGVPADELRELTGIAEEIRDAGESGRLAPGAHVPYYAWSEIRGEGSGRAPTPAREGASERSGLATLPSIVSVTGHVVTPLHCSASSYATSVIAGDIRHPRGDVVIVEPDYAADRLVEGAVALAQTVGGLSLRDVIATESGPAVRMPDGTLDGEAAVVGIVLCAMRD